MKRSEPEVPMVVFVSGTQTPEVRLMKETGHKTVEVVLKHYFKPGREHLRTVLGDKFPDVLTGGERRAEAVAGWRSKGGAVGDGRTAARGGDAVKELAALAALEGLTVDQLKKLIENAGAEIKKQGEKANMKSAEDQGASNNREEIVATE